MADREAVGDAVDGIGIVVAGVIDGVDPGAALHVMVGAAVDDGRGGAGLADGGVGGIAQVQREAFQRFADVVADDGDMHGLGGHAGREHQLAGRIDVVVRAARSSSALAGVVVDRDLGRRCGIQADHELGIAILFADDEVVDADERLAAGCRAMRADRRLAAATGNGNRLRTGAGDRAEHQAEGLCRFGAAVALQRNLHVLDGFSGPESERAGGGQVVAAGVRAAVGGAVGNAEAGAERLVEHHGEGGAAGAGVDDHVAHRQAGRIGAVGDAVIVDDGGHAVRIGNHAIGGV